MRLVLPLLLLALPAQAQSPRDALFPSDGACYLRHYDRAHLTAHPNQLVEEIAIGPEPGSMEADVLVLRLALYLRGRDEQFRAAAYCENDGAGLGCHLEGDAGWFVLEPGPKGMRLRVGRDGLWFEGASGQVTLGGGQSDDAVLALKPVPADSCP